MAASFITRVGPTALNRKLKSEVCYLGPALVILAISICKYATTSCILFSSLGVFTTPHGSLIQLMSRNIS